MSDRIEEIRARFLQEGPLTLRCCSDRGTLLAEVDRQRDEIATLRSHIDRMIRERDTLWANLATVRRERDEARAARRALEVKP